MDDFSDHSSEDAVIEAMDLKATWRPMLTAEHPEQVLFKASTDETKDEEYRNQAKYLLFHIGYKLCTTCNELKDIEMFSANRSRSDGYRYDCKACFKKDSK